MGVLGKRDVVTVAYAAATGTPFVRSDAVLFRFASPERAFGGAGAVTELLMSASLSEILSIARFCGTATSVIMGLLPAASNLSPVSEPAFAQSILVDGIPSRTSALAKPRCLPAPSGVTICAVARLGSCVLAGAGPLRLSDSTGLVRVPSMVSVSTAE